MRHDPLTPARIRLVETVLWARSSTFTIHLSSLAIEQRARTKSEPRPFYNEPRLFSLDHARLMTGSENGKRWRPNKTLKCRKLLTPRKGSTAWSWPRRHGRFRAATKTSAQSARAPTEPSGTRYTVEFISNDVGGAPEMRTPSAPFSSNKVLAFSLTPETWTPH